MLRLAAARLGEERASTNIVRGKRNARLLTNLVSLRILEEHASNFTRTFLPVSVCVVCRRTGLVECVEQSEGLRRDGA
jgi:hypothetical protein